MMDLGRTIMRYRHVCKELGYQSRRCLPNANSVQREGRDMVKASAGAIVKKRDARSNGFPKRLLHHAEVKGSKVFIADMAEALQDILIGLGRVCGSSREIYQVELRKYRFHRNRKRRDMDDACEYARMSEIEW
jgi:hypothetical protein